MWGFWRMSVLQNRPHLRKRLNDGNLGAPWCYTVKFRWFEKRLILLGFLAVANEWRRGRPTRPSSPWFALARWRSTYPSAIATSWSFQVASVHCSSRELYRHVWAGIWVQEFGGRIASVVLEQAQNTLD